MPLDEIKANLKGSRLILGTDRTIKNLKSGKISKVFLSGNCSERVRSDIGYYGKIGSCPVEMLDVPNEELGLLCKKPFSVSVVGLLKQ